MVVKRPGLIHIQPKARAWIKVRGQQRWEQDESTERVNGAHWLTHRSWSVAGWNKHCLGQSYPWAELKVTKKSVSLQGFSHAIVYLAVLGLHCFVAFSLVAARGGYSLVARVSHCGGCSYCRAWGLGWGGFSSCSSQALEFRFVFVARGLSCSVACGIFPDQGSHVPCTGRWILYHWATREAHPMQFKIFLILK